MHDSIKAFFSTLWSRLSGFRGGGGVKCLFSIVYKHFLPVDPHPSLPSHPTGTSSARPTFTPTILSGLLVLMGTLDLSVESRAQDHAGDKAVLASWLHHDGVVSLEDFPRRAVGRPAPVRFQGTERSRSITFLGPKLWCNSFISTIHSAISGAVVRGCPRGLLECSRYPSSP